MRELTHDFRLIYDSILPSYNLITKISYTQTGEPSSKKSHQISIHLSLHSFKNPSPSYKLNCPGLLSLIPPYPIENRFGSINLASGVVKAIPIL